MSCSDLSLSLDNLHGIKGDTASQILLVTVHSRAPGFSVVLPLPRSELKLERVKEQSKGESSLPIVKHGYHAPHLVD